MIALCVFLVLATLSFLSIYRKNRKAAALFTIATWIGYEALKVELYLSEIPALSLQTSSLIFLTLCSLSIIVLTLSYTLTTTRRINLKYFFKINERRALRLRNLVVLLSLILFYKWSNGNIFYFLSRRLGNQDAQELVSSKYIFVLVNIWCIYFTGYQIIIKRKSRDIAILLIIYSYLFLFNGSRGVLAYSLAFILWGLWREGIVKTRRIAPIVLIIGIGFSYLGLVRNRDENRSLEELSASSYQAQLRDEHTFNRWYDSNTFLLGTSYFNLVTFPIPRAVLGDLKPVMLDGVIAKRVFGRDDLGMPVHPVTESFINFGYLGLVIFVAFGVILKFIDNIKAKADFYPIAFSLFLSSTLFSTYIIYALQFLVVHMFLTFIINLKWS